MISVPNDAAAILAALLQDDRAVARARRAVAGSSLPSKGMIEGLIADLPGTGDFDDLMPLQQSRVTASPDTYFPPSRSAKMARNPAIAQRFSRLAQAAEAAGDPHSAAIYRQQAKDALRPASSIQVSDHMRQRAEAGRKLDQADYRSQNGPEQFSRQAQEVVANDEPYRYGHYPLGERELCLAMEVMREHDCSLDDALAALR